MLMHMIKKHWKNIKNYVEKANVSMSAMQYIYWYVILLMICASIYVISWLADWWNFSKANLAEFRAFIHEITGAPWIAVIGFVGKHLVDKNNNGIPDVMEEEEKEHGATDNN